MNFLMFYRATISAKSLFHIHYMHKVSLHHNSSILSKVWTRSRKAFHTGITSMEDFFPSDFLFSLSCFKRKSLSLSLKSFQLIHSQGFSSLFFFICWKKLDYSLQFLSHWNVSPPYDSGVRNRIELCLKAFPFYSPLNE